MSFASVETPESSLQADPDAVEAGSDSSEGSTSQSVDDSGAADGGTDVSDAARTLGESRKDRKADRFRLRQQAEADRARADAEKQRADALQRSIDGLTREMQARREEDARNRPAAEDPNVKKLQALREKSDSIAQRMANDPSAYKEWRDVEGEIADLRAEIKADAKVREFAEKQRENAPRPVPADVQRLATEFTWLSENKDARQATEIEIKRLVNKHRRDMSNPKVRFATMREAAANVAAAWDLDPGYEPDSAAAQRLSGPGGKMGVAGGGDIEVARDEDKMAMAKALYPNDDEDTAWRKFSKEVAAPVMAQQKKR